MYNSIDELFTFRGIVVNTTIFHSTDSNATKFSWNTAHRTQEQHEKNKERKNEKRRSRKQNLFEIVRKQFECLFSWSNAGETAAHIQRSCVIKT